MNYFQLSEPQFNAKIFWNVKHKPLKLLMQNEIWEYGPTLSCEFSRSHFCLHNSFKKFDYILLQISSCPLRVILMSIVSGFRSCVLTMRLIEYPVSIVNQSTSSVTPYAWEATFDFVATRKWVTSYRNLIFFSGIFYVFAIFALQRYMKRRPAYRLKTALTIWNLVLAVLSTLAFSRLLPEMKAQLAIGVHHSICNWNEHNIVTAYWIYVLLLLKFVELGDTVFIVLRKQKLIFLHWYHHVSMLLSCWIGYEIYEPRALWATSINSFVHSVMYSYYALKAFGIKIPRQFSMMITILQILQMIALISGNFYAFSMLLEVNKSYKCGVSLFSAVLAAVVVTPYLFLFLQFFYDAYICERRRPEAVSEKNIPNQKSQKTKET